MYDPKVRMMILVSIIVVVATLISILNQYVFGSEGLDIQQYLTGAVKVGAVLFIGFSFVWISTKFMTFESFKQSGFEPVFKDETGTGFNFPVSLSKFLPEIIAEPYDPKMHALEAELIGFLNGYRSWPYDISGNNSETLYTHAMDRWEAMKHVPQAGPLHRVAALAQDLGKIYAYAEKRKSFPMIQFWKQDSVRHVQRCEEHGGLSAFLLSTMPAFKKLGKNYESNQKYRRVLLAAIRYRNDPNKMPANIDPLVKGIYESLHMADRIAMEQKGNNVDNFDPSESDVNKLKTEITSFFQAMLRDVDLNPASLDKSSVGVYLGKGLVAVHMSKFINHYASLLSPEMRGEFNLWQMDAQKHPVWPYFIETFRHNKVLVESWENIQAADGLFSLRIDDINFSSCLMLQVHDMEYPDLRKILDTFPAFTGMVEAQQDRDTLIAEIKRKAERVNSLLKKLDG